MTKRIDPVLAVFDRLALEFPAPAFFMGYEISDWPPHALKALVDSGLLASTTRARSAVCTGCEYGCHKPVIVRRVEGTRGVRAIIMCDEEPGLGRIRVGLDRIARFQCSLASAATFTANALKIGPAVPTARHGVFALGEKRGRLGPRPVWLTIKDRRTILRVDKQDKDLCDLVSWQRSGLHVDHASFQRLANQKGRQTKKSSPEQVRDATRSTARKRLIAERDQKIEKHGRGLVTTGMPLTRASSEIALMSFVRAPRRGLRPISAASVRRILTRARRRSGW